MKQLRLTILSVLATILLLCGIVIDARAQTPVIAPALATTSCFPGVDNATHTATPARAGLTKNGGWLRWYCVPRDLAKPVEVYRYVATPAELSKWGGRLQTIAKAADPLASLRAAGTRFTILPLTDPSLAAIVADMDAAP
jgi:hypothetical protein